MSNEDIATAPTTPGLALGRSVRANLSIHDDSFSREPVLFAQTYLTSSGIASGTLVELSQSLDTTEVRDFESKATASAHNDPRQDQSTARTTTYLCTVKAFVEPSNTQRNLQVSINKVVAGSFNFVSRAQVSITVTEKQKWAASHVEISFRDAYLSRSDMWRFVSQELAGRTVYAGQKLSFLNTFKLTVRSLHVHGRHSQVAYFDSSTIPVFRSEAARYVIFIQMSREMWDFDSEGNGEILFNRVVNGFLPELFKRWSSMEVRHLVSIIMFGRLEYGSSDLADSPTLGFKNTSSILADAKPVEYQDFYRVVVTDMASAQWATILEELKRDFRVFLRDVSLFKAPETAAGLEDTEMRQKPVRITGRLSGALKGNILEAINIAASQFSNDYVDRDLIRTGISTVVVTAGSGVFDVDRDLLKTTSDMLTNNGIGIDVVCLSRMPLHSVPLFRYRLKDEERSSRARSSFSPSSLNTSLAHGSLPEISHSPAFSSTNDSVTYFSRFPSAYPASVPQIYGYGIPQWIDLSYWSSEMGHENSKHRRRLSHLRHGKFGTGELFVPRVRMYELQMMGLMELGMAEIVIPYLNERNPGDISTMRRRNARASQSRYNRSFSPSPELQRKNPLTAKRSYGQFQFLRDQASIEARLSSAMDHYDNSVFDFSSTGAWKERSRRKTEKPKMHKRHAEEEKREEVSPKLSSRISSSSLKTKSDADSRSIRSNIMPLLAPPKQPARAPKSITNMLRGLASIKASAVTPEIHIENVAAQRMGSDLTDGSSDENRPSLKVRIKSSSRSSRLSLEQNETTSLSSRPSTAATKIESSKPIKINPGIGTSTGESSMTKQLWRQRQQHRSDRPQSSRFVGDERSSDSEDKLSDNSNLAESHPDSLPANVIPFVRNVNASNPLKRSNQSGTFGRWQHLYPRKPRSATVKWRSLCTPASIPLTTDDFPSKDELQHNYDAICHIVRTRGSDETVEDSEAEMHALFLEMISLRIAHGYQFVTGTGVANAIEEPLSDYFSICHQDARSRSKLVIVLAMGNTIQKLEFQRSLSVRVTRYTQKEPDQAISPRPVISYNPYIRTILANNYSSRYFRFQGFSEQYPWDMADDHLAGEDNNPPRVVEQLRYWRARFVLLPVEPPVSAWKAHQTDENEEEIHLLGIRALTQLWQKYRYTTAQERRILESRTSSTRSRDLNPLEVKMETLNPSELIALELDRLSQIEDGADQEWTQLLPEPQKLDQETSMQKFAAAMQGDRGIDIKARRWHWKMHYNCFHGEEFTNWLLHNVKNLNTREDAVDFGNQLMKEGLFEHVNGRHKFKDGTYFYSIKPEFRSTRLEQNKHWFLNNRPANKPVAPVPISEQPPKEGSPLSVRTRSGSNIAQQLNATSGSESLSSFEKKRKAVSLSRMIRVDVDPRKKSFFGRSEVVHVHYDRFHNPENCYHLELNWLSTTCKLVDDAIGTWTNTAEKYGLKLVEVPIAEAYDVPIAEPFRSPYRIKLALEPPKQKPNSITFHAVNFSAPPIGGHQVTTAPAAGKHVYQKAILKRSNFVLDLEAASEFPEGVDIHYSWGQLDYKYTQFVHRSGIILAQIMDNGDIILLANRLYNSRLVNVKEAGNRNFDSRRDAGPQAHRPALPPSFGMNMQASGIVGVNVASPSVGSGSSPSLNPVASLGTHPSPLPRIGGQLPNLPTPSHGARPAIADSFGPRSTFAATGQWNTLITPERIKDDLETFCQDKSRLEQFYKEVANAPTHISSGQGSGSRKTTGSSSSSLLRPIREVPGTMASDITGIPAFELPEAVTAVQELKKANAGYENTIDLQDRTKVGSLSDSMGSENDAENSRAGSVAGANDLVRKDTK